MVATICMLKLVILTLKIINILINIIISVLNHVQNIGIFMVDNHIIIAYHIVKVIKICKAKVFNIYKEINVLYNVIIMLNGYKKMMGKNVKQQLIVQKVIK